MLLGLMGFYGSLKMGIFQRGLYGSVRGVMGFGALVRLCKALQGSRASVLWSLGCTAEGFYGGYH